MNVDTTLLFVLAGVAVVVAMRLVATRTGVPAAALLTIATFSPGARPPAISRSAMRSRCFSDM